MLHLSPQVMSLLVFFFKSAVQVVGDVDGSRLDLAWSSLGSRCRQWRGHIQELEESGCNPGRWAIANGSFFYFNSFQSQWAMGLLQLVWKISFSSPSTVAGGDRGRQIHDRFRGFFVISFFFKVFRI